MRYAVRSARRVAGSEMSKNRDRGQRSGKSERGAARPRSGSNSNSWKAEQSGGDYYAPYLDEDTVERGNYLRGYVRVNPRKKTEAYVSCDGIGVDIRVDDEKLRNRSLDGDLVALEILPEEEWLEFSVMLKGKLKLVDDDEEETSVGPSEVILEEDEEAVRRTQERLWRPLVDMTDKTTTVQQPSDDGKETGKSELEEKSLRLGLQPRAKVVRILETKRVEGLVGGIQLKSPLSVLGCVPGSSLPASVQSGYFQPTDSRYPSLFVPRASFPEHLLTAPHEALEQIYLADISDYWSPRSRLPQGEHLRPLGQAGDLETETTALLMMNNCDHGAFTEEVLGPLRDKLRQSMMGGGSTSTAASAGATDGGEEAEEDAVHWRIPREELERRRDLRGYRIFTIDPPNAKDLDDALHITPLGDNNNSDNPRVGSKWGYDIPSRFEVGVHIADVSYFIEKDSALDAEARKRATSVYLVQRVIPMLPAILCEQLCSLNPNVDRLAFSCIWQMNADGSLVEGTQPWFGRTVIRSCAKMDYPTAQRMIDGLIPSSPSSSLPITRTDGGGGAKSDDEEDGFLVDLPEQVWETWRRPPTKLPDGTPGHKAWRCARDVCYMHSIASNRRKSRLRNGSLVLTNCKLSFSLDASTGNPANVTTYTIRDSNHLVEEYMLLANYLVAQEMLLTFPAHAFIRSHGHPDTTGLKELEKVVNSLGFNLDTTNSKTVQDSLTEITQQASPLVVKIITNMLTKPIPEAQYRRSGSDPAQWKHYALAIPYYTHFTSPIRRYADVMVHRLLEACLQIKSSNTDAGAGAGVEVVTQVKEEVECDASTRNQDQTAAHCNEMKRASKMAQMRSDRVYLAVYLSPAHAGPQECSGYVIGIGNRSFSVFVPSYGVDDRLFVDNMPFVESAYEEASKVLTLSRRAPQTCDDNGVDNNRPTGRAAERPNSLTFQGSIKIELLSSVRILLSAKRGAGPVDVVMSLIDLDPDASLPSYPSVTLQRP